MFRFESFKRGSMLFANLNSFVLFLAFFALFIKTYQKVTPAFPRWQRQGRVVENVRKYSALLSREAIESDSKFRKFTDLLATWDKPPYLLYLDKGYLEVTLNHICNLQYMPGSIRRLAVVSFDPEVEKQLNAAHPHIPTVTLDFSVIKKSVPDELENRRYVIYQLVLMLRSHIAAVLSSRGISFWSMQQDSIWTENFVAMNVEEHYSTNHLIFDTVGNDQFSIYYRTMFGWICGSTFFVRAGPVTVDFFKKVALLMATRQSPDSSIMTYLCGARFYKCAKLPRWVVSSSNFFMGNRNVTPIIIQVDHESKLSKMELFKKENFIFVNSDGTCNASAVVGIRNAVTVALDEVRKAPEEIDGDEESLIDHIIWSFHRWLGFDPYYNKRFLRVHETLV